jgi:hypothetical protein
MPLPVLPGVLRITVHGECEGGGRWSNTWHARNDSLIDWDEAGVDAFHDIFSVFYVGPDSGASLSVLGHCSAGTTVDGFDYTPLDGASGAITKATVGDGEATVPSLPAQNAEVITIRTAQRGRQNRGRVFLPAWSNDYSDAAGHILAAGIVSILAKLQEAVTAIATGGAHLGVGSYGPYKDPVTGLPVVGTPHFTPATSFTMDNLFDAIRSRKN